MASYSARQPMSPAQLINQARQAIKQGQRQEAQRLLNEAARLEPDNEMIWLWLASVAPSPQLSLEYVQRAEAINPTNPRVAEARRWAERRLREMQIPNLPTPETAAHTPHKKKGKTAVIWATLFIILFLIVGVISLFLWNQLQSPTAVRAQLPDAQQAAILPEQLPVNKAPKAAEHTATPKP
ncbi:MAG: hypothetical protein GY796_20550, partial [Chloroflexi bacterium]|nr:hypothetical protein [Chloroflexota bacterium]